MAGWATRAWMGRARYLDIGSDHPCRQGEGRLCSAARLQERGARLSGDRPVLGSISAAVVGGVDCRGQVVKRGAGRPRP